MNGCNGKISNKISDTIQVRGGILADQMGLGKTVMTIALIHSDLEQQREIRLK